MVPLDESRPFYQKWLGRGTKEKEVENNIFKRIKHQALNIFQSMMETIRFLKGNQIKKIDRHIHTLLTENKKVNIQYKKIKSFFIFNLILNLYSGEMTLHLPIKAEILNFLWP